MLSTPRKRVWVAPQFGGFWTHFRLWMRVSDSEAGAGDITDDEEEEEKQ